MKKLIKISLLIIILVGCEKWVSVDISGDFVTLISPVNDQYDSIQTKTFIWEELEGANQYRLQIVAPAFDSVLYYIVDTPLNGTVFSTSLLANKYQWRVRGENSDFNSIWNERSLEIKNTQNLSNQTISGINPINGTNSNSLNQSFVWNFLSSAEYYTIIIYDSDDDEINLQNSNSENYEFLFPDEGFYSVKIKAINDISASVSAEVSLFIDTTAPSFVTLEYPSYDTIYSFPKNFEWSENLTNDGSLISNRLLIASDSLMNNILVDSIFTSSSTIALDSVETNGKLFWKINRTDAAGNSNNSSKSKRFYIF